MKKIQIINKKFIEKVKTVKAENKKLIRLDFLKKRCLHYFIY